MITAVTPASINAFYHTRDNCKIAACAFVVISDILILYVYVVYTDVIYRIGIMNIIFPVSTIIK